ncbi:MAG: NADH-quinone oxidoreductase subunit J [Nocardiaceae bacterium]|nr:NADH-quinone oxidoreductase subunit J [Nocardiaceae bacterium]
MVDEIPFFIFATVAVIGALGTVGMRKAVHSAIMLAMTMIVLAILYIMQGALFLGVVQIVVYTGAVMMLFLFVLMLVGVDSSDSLTETIRGQRFGAIVAGLGFGVIAIGGLGAAGVKAAPHPKDSTVADLADLIFIKYLWAFELTGALLIIATIGAMVLAHRERYTPRPTQREMTEERLRTGQRITPRPNPGVYARHNAVNQPARLPDGSAAEESVASSLRDKR